MGFGEIGRHKRAKDLSVFKYHISSNLITPPIQGCSSIGGTVVSKTIGLGSSPSDPARFIILFFVIFYYREI